jgi:hypothetical protein
MLSRDCFRTIRLRRRFGLIRLHVHVGVIVLLAYL